MNVVTLPYDHVWTALEWAKKNCPSYITNCYHLAENYNLGDKTQIDYYFAKESDAVLFALKWA